MNLIEKISVKRDTAFVAFRSNRVKGIKKIPVHGERNGGHLYLSDAHNPVEGNIFSVSVKKGKKRREKGKYPVCTHRRGKRNGQRQRGRKNSMNERVSI